jgi:hypothetical protein
MVSEAIMSITQFAIMFAVTIVFSVIALERKTVVSQGLAMLLWVSFAIMNFILGSSVIGVATSWLLGLIGFVFAGTFIMSMYESYMDTKHSRFEF